MIKENAKLLKEKVYYCLEHYPKARNSDKFLVCTVYYT